MPLASGTRFGAYEIVEPLGAGGMGEVYRARDARLKRDVALKVLHASLANDPDRLARFQREAHVLASLSHPNIGAIFGLEDSGGTAALVLELVEGPTLAERLASGPLPPAEALSVARQIGAALGTAHDSGVVHRDLKPANIKTTPSGLVKVLDFGLAKLSDPAGDAARVTSFPTTSISMPGTLLGTPAYMAPEQATAQAVDRLVDIWAFGCVLYEMLTGLRAFDGASTSAVIAEILKSDPDWSLLPSGTPENVRRLLRHCLRKDPRARLHHIADAVIEIDDLQSESSASAPSKSTAKSTWPIWALGTTLIAAAAAGATWMLRPQPPAAEMRFELAAEATSDVLSLAVSPDGRAIVYSADSAGRPRLWLRSLDTASTHAMTGTEGGYYPFWSPDGHSLGFFADGKLKRLDLATGSVQTLATATAGRGGTWNANGVIVFAPQAGPLYRIPASGGEPIALTYLEADRGSKRFPQFLPDGRHFLYLVRDASVGTKGIYVSQLDQAATRHVVDADSAGVYVTTGHLLFGRQGTLFAQKFDASRLLESGTAVPVATELAVNQAVGSSAVSSGNGVVAYRTGAEGAVRRLAWFDRSGHEIGGTPSPDRLSDWSPALSPDGRRIALTRLIDRNEDIWLLDGDRTAPKRLTFDAARDAGAVWSPDGTRVVFVSTRSGVGALMQKSADGTGEETPVSDPSGAGMPSDWSPDGRFILYTTQDANTKFDIWALPLQGDRRAFPLLQTTFNERDAQFSPDGKWIAYESDESGQFEVYVRPFPGPGPAVPISTNGGAQARWKRDGTELFYIALDDRLMTVPIRFDTARQSVIASAPQPLFLTRVGGAVTVTRQQYAVTPDGERFVMNLVEPRATPITLLLNWTGR